MSTVQEVADAIETVVGELPGTRTWSEYDENPDPADVAVEIFLDRRIRTDSCGGQAAIFGIEISAKADSKGWGRAIRNVRDYLDDQDTKSIEAALIADRTLGGVVDTLAVTRVGGEQRVDYPEGGRFRGEIIVEVQYKGG